MAGSIYYEHTKGTECRDSLHRSPSASELLRHSITQVRSTCPGADDPQSAGIPAREPVRIAVDAVMHPCDFDLAVAWPVGPTRMGRGGRVTHPAVAASRSGP
jgi:hypothetical protein